MFKADSTISLSLFALAAKEKNTSFLASALIYNRRAFRAIIGMGYYPLFVIDIQQYQLHMYVQLASCENATPVSDEDTTTKKTMVCAQNTQRNGHKDINEPRQTIKNVVQGLALVTPTPR